MEKIFTADEALVEARKLFEQAVEKGYFPTIVGQGLCHDEQLRNFGRNLGLTPQQIAEALQLSELPYGGGFERVQEAMSALAASKQNP